MTQGEVDSVQHLEVCVSDLDAGLQLELISGDDESAFARMLHASAVRLRKETMRAFTVHDLDVEAVEAIDSDIVIHAVLGIIAEHTVALATGRIAINAENGTLGGLAVAKPFRGDNRRGYGSRILEQLEEQASMRGVKNISVTSSRDKEAVAFYRANGYVLVNRPTGLIKYL